MRNTPLLSHTVYYHTHRLPSFIHLSFIYSAGAFIQIELTVRYRYTFSSELVPQGIEPMILVLLVPCCTSCSPSWATRFNRLNKLTFPFLTSHSLVFLFFFRPGPCWAASGERESDECGADWKGTFTSALKVGRSGGDNYHANDDKYRSAVKLLNLNWPPWICPFQPFTRALASTDGQSLKTNIHKKREQNRGGEKEREPPRGASRPWKRKGVNERGGEGGKGEREGSHLFLYGQKTFFSQILGLLQMLMASFF